MVEALKPEINVESTDDILSTLDKRSLSAFKDRVAAMPSRFDQILLESAKLMEPDVQQVSLPSHILKTEEDIESWLKDIRQLLVEKLTYGPVIPH